MIRRRLATATLVAAAVVAMSAPSYAQRAERRHGGQQQHAQARATARVAPPQARQAPPRARDQGARDPRPQAQRAQPRGNFRPQAQPAARGQDWRSQPRSEVRPPAQPRSNDQPRNTYQPRSSYQPRNAYQPRNTYQPRSAYQAPPAQSRGNYPRPSQSSRGLADRHIDERRYATPRPYRPSYGSRGEYNGGDHGGYQSYRSYRPYRSYAIPYGYHRHGSAGWSFNLYFGRPYGHYGYGRPAAYGYYPIPSGYVFGSVRIVDAPPDAQVFVDGYYAGVVDDYDGVFQHLNLVPGPHRIDIQLPGYAPIGFDVFVQPGQTITYRASLY